MDSTAKTFIVHIFFCRKRQVEMLTSPFKYALLIMCSASDANSSGFPRRDGQGIPCVLISSLGMQDADTNIESGNKNRQKIRKHISNCTKERRRTAGFNVGGRAVQVAAGIERQLRQCDCFLHTYGLQRFDDVRFESCKHWRLKCARCL